MSAIRELCNKVRPQILVAVAILGTVAILLVLHSAVEAAVGVAGLIASISNRILESQDKT